MELIARPGNDRAEARTDSNASVPRPSVRTILAIEDPCLRNLWITQTYADLGRRLSLQLGVDHSWCSFAVWASNTAGVSIRSEELPAPLTAVLRDAGSHVNALAAESVEQVSTHIAHGNTLVFAELAPIFVRFIERFELDTPARETLEEVLDEIGVPIEPVEPLVRRAFRLYYLAILETDLKIRAELVLAANISAVLHEQQKLQQDIALSLDACVIDVAERVEAECERHLPASFVHRIVDAAVEHSLCHAELVWEHLATRLLMTLDVPGETLKLARDVPRLPDGRRFPDALVEVSQPELAELLVAWDPTNGTAVESGAADWADLHQRMGYIVNLFRSRQQCATLGDAPFSDDQLRAMAGGRVPDSV